MPLASSYGITERDGTYTANGTIASDNFRSTNRNVNGEDDAVLAVEIPLTLLAIQYGDTDTLFEVGYQEEVGSR